MLCFRNREIKCRTIRAAPVLFAAKKDGRIRFFLDYRRLNAVSVGYAYSLLSMEKCIDSPGTAKNFSALDSNSGYWKIKVREEDRDKTDFVCHAGYFRHKRIPFWLKNAPATF